MGTIDDLLQRNVRFAATDAKDRVPVIPFVPNQQLYVITCLDPRVDPAFIFGLALGDAVVARTLGGRVTPAVIQDLAWISYLHEVKAPDADWFDLAVVHHTGCGRGLDDDALLRGFAERGGDDVALAEQAVFDPAQTVPADVRKLIDAPLVSAKIKISGYEYDVETGLLKTLVPPKSRADG
ncbi:carbonic anhydrase [Micromonospora taraxaci]|uniref:carbonic anhydrase n=1 Tax=Micromonospora taraxaci TaxID=1316803 RepID=A0A561W3A5_9ACTN|nr:carbonic anhydrase [Micromonospora taraxaci]TWG18335.1 carbonic anhydrase [Micromonospora taraxaci]